MTPNQDQPNQADWQRLYQATEIYRQLAPWEWMDDDHIFGVECQEAGEIYYCGVLGGLGEVFALVAYEGREGLDGYLKLLSGEIEEGPLVTECQRALMASFENRSDLDPRDREVIGAMGRKYRGSHAWPVFRHYLPGYFPWFLTASQARTLAACLEQAVAVLPRHAFNRKLLGDPTAGHHLVRVCKISAGREEWHDEILPSPSPQKASPTVPVNEVGIARLHRQTKRRAGDWKIGYCYAPMPVQEHPDQRPYFLRLLGIVDAESGFVLSIQLEAPDKHLPVFRDLILSCLEEASQWPKRLLVNHDDAAALAAPIAAGLGLSLKRVRDLPGFAAAFDGMIATMRRKKR